jgi:orotate phosphoribosyltransferase
MNRLTVAVPAADSMHLLKESGAVLEGHFLLSSGLHSPQYFQCAKVLEHAWTAERVAQAVARFCRELGVQTVISPALGAILFGYELSRSLHCRNIFAERPAGAFELRRGFSLEPGERVLLAENVITTGGSVLETARLVRDCGAQVLGYAVIVDRSGGRFAPEEPVIAYAAMDAVTYEPSLCPMCAKGHSIDKPGSRKITV